MINNNINGYNPNMSNVSYGAVKDVVPQSVNQKLPENLQNLDAKQIAENNGALSTAEGMNAKTMALSLPFYTSFLLLRNLNDKKGSPFSFSGEYDKTFLGKLTKFGDKIHNKICKGNWDEKLKERLGGAKRWFQNHSAFARSLSTPLKLESSFAISQASGLYSQVMYDNADLIEKGFRERGKDVIEMFKKGSNGKFWELLKQNGIENIAKDDEALGIVSRTLRDLAQKNIKLDSEKAAKEAVDDVINIFSKTDKTAVIDKWGPLPIGKIPGLKKLLTLKVPMSEAANKTKVATGAITAAGGTAAATTLGKALPSAFSKVYEALTNNYAGGKIAPLLQAYFLAQAAMRAKDAPEGQKLATFMDEEAMGVATLFTMPLATNIMTKLGGGLKYMGMGKTVEAQIKNVDKYRNMVADLNKLVDGGSLTRGEYVNKVKEIKKVLKGDTKFWQKPFKALGKLFGSNYKAETIKPFIDDKIPANASKLQQLGLNVSNKIQKALYGFKTGKFFGITPGGIARFAVVMFVLSPLLSKPIKWVVNKIFGKPYDPVKEKEEQEKKAQEEMMKNNPFAKMSEQELLELLSKNQDTLMQIQNNPALMQELQTNPQKLYDILKEGAMKKDAAIQNSGPSPILQTYINNRNPQNPYVQPQPSGNIYQPSSMTQIMNTNGFNMNQNSAMNINPASMPAPSVQNQAPKQNGNQNNGIVEPQRSYIPSSKPADFSAVNNAEAQRFNSIIADMDRTEKEFSKYLSI